MSQALFARAPVPVAFGNLDHSHFEKFSKSLVREVKERFSDVEYRLLMFQARGSLKWRVRPQGTFSQSRHQ